MVNSLQANLINNDEISGKNILICKRYLDSDTNEVSQTGLQTYHFLLERTATEYPNSY